MTKEEKIKEAYGEHFDKIKYVVDKNGWILMSISITREINIQTDKEVRIHENNTSGSPTICVRPISLSGIENNNGWNKIESEADLPKEDLQCWLIDEEFGTDIGYFSFNTKAWYVDNVQQFVTHYQPIQKPKPPIY